MLYNTVHFTASEHNSDILLYIAAITIRAARNFSLVFRALVKTAFKLTRPSRKTNVMRRIKAMGHLSMPCRCAQYRIVAISFLPFEKLSKSSLFQKNKLNWHPSIHARRESVSATATSFPERPGCPVIYWRKKTIHDRRRGKGEGFWSFTSVEVKGNMGREHNYERYEVEDETTDTTPLKMKLVTLKSNTSFFFSRRWRKQKIFRRNYWRENSTCLYQVSSDTEKVKSPFSNLSYSWKIYFGYFTG